MAIQRFICYHLDVVIYSPGLFHVCCAEQPMLYILLVQVTIHLSLIVHKKGGNTNFVEFRTFSEHYHEACFQKRRHKHITVRGDFTLPQDMEEGDQDFSMVWYCKLPIKLVIVLPRIRNFSSKYCMKITEPFDGSHLQLIWLL